MKKLIIAVVLVGMFLLCVLIQVDRFHVYFEARKAYLSSRHGEPESHEFICRGIKKGMDSDRVTALMAKANKTILKMPQSSPNWDGFVNLYIFYYGPKWHNPITNSEEWLIEEWFWVYFNSDGKAVKLRRTTVGENRFWKRQANDGKGSVLAL